MEVPKSRAPTFPEWLKMQPRQTANHHLECRQWPRSAIRHHQCHMLNRVFQWVRNENAFYRTKLSSIHDLPQQIASFEDWETLPFTTKHELTSDHPLGVAANHTWSADRYSRFHRTSGTHGSPMVFLDTSEDWEWWLDTWQFVLDAASVSNTDRVFMAFSYGPFIGFWSAHESCLKRGAMVIPGGGLSSAARIDLLFSSQATVLCCTPSYALHLAELASQRGIDLAKSAIRQVIVAGEPGGSVKAIRSRIESAWGAKVTDHAGATEIGPWGVGLPDGSGLEIIETEFYPEYLPVDPEQGLFELVLTNFHRHGCPLLRYRTGDLVRPEVPDQGFTRLVGGVVGRVDDMMIVRGVNVFPSSLDAILRSFPEVAEYRIIATRSGELDQLAIEVEDQLHQTERIADQIQLRLGLRVEVRDVPSHSLPRFEGKAKRFQDLR